MMKDQLKNFWRVPYPVFAVLLVIGLAVSTMALRANNQHMIQLRSVAYEADKAGSGVEEALDNLRGYVYAHMNTNLASGGNAIKPPIQLKYSYKRLVKAEQQRINQANDRIYREA